MMVAEGGVLASVVVLVVLIVVGGGPAGAVVADTGIDKASDVVVAAVGIGTCGAGRFMILSEGGEGSRGR
jgi:hypothetical protein